MPAYVRTCIYPIDIWITSHSTWCRFFLTRHPRFQGLDPPMNILHIKIIIHKRNVCACVRACACMRARVSY